jgi:hypothetical protein
MSLKEIKKVFSLGFNQYLIESGFNKPQYIDGLRIISRNHEDRKIYISSSPRIHNSFIYEFRVPGIKEQSIFSYNNKYLDYQFNSIGWYEYKDIYDLIKIFGIIKDIHDSWLNNIFMSSDISEFVNHVNKIHQSYIEQFAKYSDYEKGKDIQQVYSDNLKISDALRNAKCNNWADSIINKYKLQ